MKKVISVSMVTVVVIAMIFALSACSSAEYTETPVTVEVTDENGEVVTDAQGNTVTEVVTDENGNAKTETKKNITVKEGKSTTAKNNSQNNGNNSNSGNSGNNNSNSGNANNSNNSGSNNNGSSNNSGTTAKADDTTKPTEKPKKRDVTITVNLPFYNKQETKLTLYYKVGNDKEYTEFEPVELILDGDRDNKKQKFTIEDVKGEIYAYIELEGISITHNDITIPAAGDGSDKGTITPVTGIEIMDGGMD